MKALPLKFEDGAYSRCEPGEATHVALQMPGPLPRRILPVITRGSRRQSPCWTWNGDVEAPTLKPSIRTRGRRDVTDEEVGRIMAGEHVDPPEEHVCHTWVNGGTAKFLGDCTHDLAGREVPLEDVDWMD
jgi:hypothetical protein